MLITSDLFLDCIVLLINARTEKNVTAINWLLKTYEEEWKINIYTETDLSDTYIRILKQIMIENISIDTPDSLQLFLLKLKNDKVLQNNRDVYNHLEGIITSKIIIDTERLERIALRIQNALLWNKTNKALRQMFGKLNRCNETLDPIKQSKEIDDVITQAREIYETSSTVASKDPIQGLVGKTSSKDKNSIKNAILEFERKCVKNVIKTGLQGLNRALGRSGIALGETVVVGARTHHYKSGILKDFCRWGFMYNTFTADEQGRKPLILAISVENEYYKNAVKIYAKMYSTMFNKAPNMSPEALADWAHEVLSQYNVEFIQEQYQPGDFGFEELVKLITFYEAQGYYIVMLVLDYVSNMKKGVSTAGLHYMINQLFNAIFCFTKSKSITTITAHQLNAEAVRLESLGKTNRVKIHSEGSLAESMGVAREPDILMFLELEYNFDGTRFLTGYVRKHRDVEDVPESHKYFAYPFTPLGIIDDINTKPGYISDIYSYSSDNLADDIQQTAEMQNTATTKEEAF